MREALNLLDSKAACSSSEYHNKVLDETQRVTAVGEGLRFETLLRAPDCEVASRYKGSIHRLLWGTDKQVWLGCFSVVRRDCVFELSSLDGTVRQVLDRSGLEGEEMS